MMKQKKKTGRESRNFEVVIFLYAALMINCFGVILGNAIVCAISNIFVVLYILKNDFYWDKSKEWWENF